PSAAIVVQFPHLRRDSEAMGFHWLALLPGRCFAMPMTDTFFDCPVSKSGADLLSGDVMNQCMDVNFNPAFGNHDVLSMLSGVTVLRFDDQLEEVEGLAAGAVTIKPTDKLD